jgi:hypothetical protein
MTRGAGTGLTLTRRSCAAPDMDPRRKLPPVPAPLVVPLPAAICGMKASPGSGRAVTIRPRRWATGDETERQEADRLNPLLIFSLQRWTVVNASERGWMVTPLSEGLTRQFRLADGFTPRDADAPVVPAGRLGTWESDRPRQGKLAYPVSHAGQPSPS